MTADEHRSALLRAFGPILRRRHLILWAWASYWFAQRAFLSGGDWHYFVEGSKLLVGLNPTGFAEPGGLHLFANYPELHMGPLSIVLAGLFALGPGDGRIAAEAGMLALGPVIVLLLERAAVAARGLRSAVDDDLLPFATLTGGLILIRAWVEVAGPVAHLDDVLVIAAATVAVWCGATRHPLLAGAAFGLAVAGKTSGILLLPLLACFPRGAAIRAGAVGFGIALVAWLPFVLGDSGTMTALQVDQANDAASGLRALGIDTATTPDWVRPAQILAGLTLGGLAVLRGRWAAALLLAVGARLALDPAVFPYYMPGLVMAALAWDLVGARRPVPIWTLGAFFALHTLPQTAASPEVQGFARVGIVLAALALLLPRPRPGGSPAPALRRLSAG